MHTIAVHPLCPAAMRADMRLSPQTSGGSNPAAKAVDCSAGVHDFLVLNPCPDFMPGRDQTRGQPRPQSP